MTVGVWSGNNNNETTAKVESLTGGGVIWHNELKGFGRGLTSLASSRRPTEASDMDLASEKRRRDAQAAAAAAAT